MEKTNLTKSEIIDDIKLSAKRDRVKARTVDDKNKRRKFLERAENAERFVIALERLL